MTPLRVGIIGAGLIGFKRARSLGSDLLVGAFDVDADATARLAAVGADAVACDSAEQLYSMEPDIIVVAVPHNLLAGYAVDALGAGAHVLVEKPAGIGVRDVELIAAAAADTDGLRVKVGFNHRFHPAISRAVSEAQSGRFGDVMFARARYGHGGRLGYDKEWRMRPELSGGGELIDQGMHLFDIFHWLLGPLPLHSALLRTQFWDTVVEDNAVVVLGADGPRDAPWGTFHVTWTEWKNMFSVEIYCRTGKLQIDGLQGSYGPPRLTIYTMSPELGPPAVEVIEYEPEDRSWVLEWEHFRDAVAAGDGRPLLGDLESAAYAWSCVEEAQRRGGYAPGAPGPRAPGAHAPRT